VTTTVGSASLAGRWVLVTGASRGIGAEVARRLAADGARLALVARSREPLETLARDLDAVAIPCDVSDDVAVAEGFTRIARLTDGSPDVIVNNAGSFTIQSVHETSVEQFRETLEVNLVAPFGFVRAFLPAMQARKRGHIVTIGSIADRAVFPGNAAYAASKHGLRALHEVLRAELRGSGVRASLVTPGPVDTELWDPIDPDTQPGYTPRAPRLTAGDVADAVRWVVLAPESVNVDELRLSRS
jgi:NADP-dependent 3-hydroxy acid dehydrogenase YdfG